MKGKGLFLLIGFISMFLFASCSYNKTAVNRSSLHSGWQFMGYTKKTKQMLYLNKKYVRYDKKGHIYKAMLKMEPNKKEQIQIKKNIEAMDKKVGANHNFDDIVFRSIINKRSGYYIVTTNCKDGIVKFHYPIFTLNVKSKTETSKNIYDFICKSKELKQ